MSLPPPPPGFVLESAAPAARILPNMPPPPPGFELESASAPTVELGGQGLRHPDGRLTELGWQAERDAIDKQRQEEISSESFLSNMAAGFGRAGPTMLQGLKQLGTQGVAGTVDLVGRYAEGLGIPAAGAARNIAGNYFDGVQQRQRDDVASERAATEGLRGTAGGMIGNVLGDIAMAAPLGGVGLAPRGAGALRGIGQATATGGAWGATQAVAEEGERAQNIGLGGAMGGGLSALGRGAMALGENVLPNNVTARALNFFNERANRTPFAQEGEALAQRTGIDLSPGAISGSRAQTGAENMARSSLFSADRAFEADEKVANQAIDYVNRVMNRISGQSVSAETVGADIQRTVRGTVDKIIENREKTAARQYASIRNVFGDRPVVTYDRTKQVLRDLLQENENVFGADAQKVRAQAQKMLDGMDATPAFTLDAARRSRGFYGRAAARKANVFDDVKPDVDATVARRLYGAMSDDLDAAAGRMDELAGFGQNMPVREGVVAQRPSEMLKQANDDYRRHSQLLQAVENSPLRRLLGDEIEVEDFLKVNTLPPETVVSRLNSMKPTELEMVRRTVQTQAPETWQQYKRLLVEDALSAAQTAPASAGARTLPFSAGNFVRALGGDKPDRIERLRAIMDPGEMAEINDALQAARRLGDKFGANHSGTGAYNEMSQALRNFTVRGLSTTAATAAGFNRIAKMMLDSGGRKALIELARLPPGSRKANDIAAYLSSVVTLTLTEPAPLELDIVGGTPVPAATFDPDAP